MKSGLILEGGAMRGLFTAGALDVLMENEITFDGVVGVSAGAIMGCNYKAKQLGRIIRYNKRFAKDYRFCSVRSLLTTGDLYGAKFCYETIPDSLDIFDKETFEKNPMNMYITCTDVATGKSFYHKAKKGDALDMKWLRASASMPLASTPVELNERKFLDGGISDSIPVKYMEHKGYDKNVVILTQPDGYRKKPMKASPAFKLLLKRHPAIFSAMKRRHIMYNKELDYIKRKEDAGELFVIRPESKLPVNRIEHNPDKMEAAYQMGRHTMECHLSELKKYLSL